MVPTAKARFSVRVTSPDEVTLLVWPSLSDGDIIALTRMLLEQFPNRALLVIGMPESVPLGTAPDASD